VSRRRRTYGRPKEPSDAGDDEGIVEIACELFPDHPLVERNFRHGLDIAIRLPTRDRMRLALQFANRRGEAAAWLSRLRDPLFGR